MGTLAQALDRIRQIAGRTRGVRKVHDHAPNAVTPHPDQAEVYLPQWTATYQVDTFGNAQQTDTYSVVVRALVSRANERTSEAAIETLIDALLTAYRADDTLGDLATDCVPITVTSLYVDVGDPLTTYRAIDLTLRVEFYR